MPNETPAFPIEVAYSDGALRFERRHNPPGPDEKVLQVCFAGEWTDVRVVDESDPDE